MASADNQHIFNELIQPLEKETFLSEFWGKSFVHIRGESTRFAGLLSWAELNRALEQHRLPKPRLRLVKDGDPIEAKRFTRDANHINPAGLATCLAEGATLIFDSVNEIFPAVGHLTQACQEVLKSHTTVNLYASWRTQKGFNLHWDGQDTMITQLEGRKNWKVYRPTVIHPFKKEGEQPPEPSEPPVWDDILETGDVLYLPRGWWHVAYPLNEASLHLTVTMIPANGLDLLRWFVKELVEYPEVRANVPALASESERAAYASNISTLLTQFSSPDLLARFLDQWEAQFPVSPRMGLPESPIDINEPINQQSLIRLSISHGLVLKRLSEDVVRYDASGVTGECAAGLLPALQKLSGLEFVKVQELIDALPDPADESKLLIVLTMLATNGQLDLANDATTDSEKS